MQTDLYKITYFDRRIMARVSYMNNTAFENEDRAKHEVTLIKAADKKNKQFYGYIIRTQFKVEKIKLRKAA